MKRIEVDAGGKPAHPGEVVREEILRAHGLTVTRAARILGVRRASVSFIIHGHTAMTPEMALRIEMAFGIDMERLLRMQADCYAYAMRQRAHEIDVERYVPNNCHRREGGA